MQIRKAKISDAESIYGLISSYAELERMLFRPISDIYENIQIFTVAEDDGRVVGCCALRVVWKALAEIKSLAVSEDYFGKGAGRSLVNAVIDESRELGVKKVFTLTLEPGFFEKLGFERVEKSSLPMKVWSDCAKCSKNDHCDETALVTGVG
jgi:amino-acid N-acetyltransferase